MSISDKSYTYTDYYPPDERDREHTHAHAHAHTHAHTHTHTQTHMKNENGEKKEEDILNPPHLRDKHLPGVKEKVEGLKREYERFEPVQCPPEPGENDGKV